MNASIVLTLYDTQLSPEISPLLGNDPLVRQSAWEPVASDRTRLDVRLSAPVYGWLVLWDDACRALVLRVRRVPRINASRPLAGLTLVVDAGHPPGGATGPTGLTEADAVLPVARLLQAMLERRGARVVMTRSTPAIVGLTDRPVIARRANAHAFLSVHLNAFGDGTNPFTNHGTSTLFFHQPSEPLARAVQRGMMQQIGQRDIGVHYQNLAIARPTWYPSALAEGLFLTFPTRKPRCGVRTGRSATHVLLPRRRRILQITRSSRCGLERPPAMHRVVNDALSFGLALFGLTLSGLVLPRHLSAQVDPRGQVQTIRTEHFRVHFAREHEPLARRAAAYAELAWLQLAAELAEPAVPVELLVADNVDFSNGFATPFPSNRIVVYALPSLFIPELRHYDHWLQLVITNELVYIFHLDRALACGGSVPTCSVGIRTLPQRLPAALDGGGLAVHYETKLTGSGRLASTEFPMIARTATLADDLPPPNEWSLTTSRFPLGQHAYGYGAMLMSQLAQRDSLGMRKFIDGVASHPIPYRVNYGVKQAFGVSVQEAWQQFRDSLQRAGPELSSSLAAGSPERGARYGVVRRAAEMGIRQHAHCRHERRARRQRRVPRARAQRFDFARAHRPPQLARCECARRERTPREGTRRRRKRCPCARCQSARRAR